MSWENHVHPHGPVTEVVPGLWAVQGSLARGPIPRNMGIVRLADGTLLLHSVVALDPDGMQALAALGTASVMVVPSRFHRSDAVVYKNRYPDLLVVAPRASRASVERLVPVDADAEQALAPLGIEAISVPGCKQVELVYDVPVDGGRALLCCDVLFNMQEHLPGVSGFFFRYVTRSTGFFGISGLGRLLFMTDRPALREWLEQQAARDDLRAIVVSHGTPVTDCAGMLRQAAARLE